jgi:hypothetical protein
VKFFDLSPLIEGDKIMTFQSHIKKGIGSLTVFLIRLRVELRRMRRADMGFRHLCRSLIPEHRGSCHLIIFGKKADELKRQGYKLLQGGLQLLAVGAHGLLR